MDDASTEPKTPPPPPPVARPGALRRVVHLGACALLALALGALLGGAALGVAHAQTQARVDNERARAEREAAAAAGPPEQENEPSDDADADTVSGALVGTTLGNGRTLGQALAALGVEARTSSQVSQALGALVPLRSLRPTDQIAVERAEGEAGVAVLRVFLVRGVVSWEVLQDEQGAWQAQARTEAMPEVQQIKLLWNQLWSGS